MFIKTYEKLREYVINNKSIATLIQMEYSAYEEATVPICTFVLKNGRETYNGLYFRLSDFKGGMEVQRQKVLEALSSGNCKYFFEATESNFSKIPGSPIAYWVSKEFLRTFENKTIDDYASTNNGFTTGDNNKFLRLWYEVPFGKIGLNVPSISDAALCDFKWFPYNKGGDFRKWFGNNEYVINWEKDGKDIKAYGHLVARSLAYQFRESVTWNKITSGTNAFRYKSQGTMFDVAGLSMFPKDREMIYYLLALCNCAYTKKYLEIISPTLNCETGHVASLPVIQNKKEMVDSMSHQCVRLSKVDWDSFETSWDFKKHPLI